MIVGLFCGIIGHVWVGAVGQDLWALLYPLADALYGEHWSDMVVDWTGLRKVRVSLHLKPPVRRLSAKHPVK